MRTSQTGIANRGYATSYNGAPARQMTKTTVSPDTERLTEKHFEISEVDVFTAILKRVSFYHPRFSKEAVSRMKEMLHADIRHRCVFNHPTRV